MVSHHCMPQKSKVSFLIEIIAPTRCQVTPSEGQWSKVKEVRPCRGYGCSNTGGLLIQGEGRFCKKKKLFKNVSQFSSVTQSCVTLCAPHESQHTRPPWPSTTPGVYSNSCPLNWRCHLTISSSVVPFSFCL